MGGSYNYDSVGYSDFFLLTFILTPLIPYTYFTFTSSASSSSKSKTSTSKSWNVKVPPIQRSNIGKKSSTISKKRIAALLIGWSIVFFSAYRVSQFKPEKAMYDPYSILGISVGLDEKAIKKHYRKLSIKFHPDKVDLEATNQTKEEVENHYTDLTKAYKALTDEEIRTNYEKYGHPDGKQEFGVGIALPSWLIEGNSRGWVMAMYVFGVGVVLPWVVGSWWYGSSRRTKDNVLTSTASTFFHHLTVDSSFQDIVSIIARADEFKALYKDSKLSDLAIEKVKEAVEARLLVVGEKLYAFEDLKEGSEEKKVAVRALVEIYARLFRVDVEGREMEEEVTSTTVLAHHVSTSLLNIALSYNWLGQYNLILSLQTFLIQALHPTYSSSLMQLPNVTRDGVQKSTAPKRIEEWVEHVEKTLVEEEKLNEDKVQEIYGMSKRELEEAVEVGKKWQDLELVSAQFKVTGEKIITPLSWVQLVLQVRLSSPSRRLEERKNNQVELKTLKREAEQVKGEEADLDELLGRKKKWGSAGEVEMEDAHAMWFPKNRKPSWQVFVGDLKNNRIFVPPQVLTDVGYDKIRTFKIQFQAPPNPSAYFFRLFIKSEVCVDADITYDMELIVMPVEALTLEDQGEEDEISDPEEDSLEGQMALMKGKQVKKSTGRREEESEDDDDESSSEEEDDDDDSSSSSDDSD